MAKTERFTRVARIQRGYQNLTIYLLEKIFGRQLDFRSVTV